MKKMSHLHLCHCMWNTRNLCLNMSSKLYKNSIRFKSRMPLLDAKVSQEVQNSKKDKLTERLIDP